MNLLKTCRNHDEFIILTVQYAFQNSSFFSAFKQNLCREIKPKSSVRKSNDYPITITQNAIVSFITVY